MKREIIAVDMDDVVVDTAQSIIDYVNRKFSSKVTLKDFYSNDLSVWNAPDDETAIRRVNEFLDTEEYYSSYPVQECVHALRGLKKYHQLYIVTGRPDFTELATRKWLRSHLPDLFEDVVFTNFFDREKIRTKGDVCHELGATVLIDDHPDHCVSALEVQVKPLLFGDFPWNVDFVLPDGMERVEDWHDVEKKLVPIDEN